MSNPKMLVCNVSAHSMLRDGQKLLNVAFTDISFAAGYFTRPSANDGLRIFNSR